MAYARRTFKGRVVRYWRQSGYGFLAIVGSNREAHFCLRDFDHAIGGDELQQGDILECYLEQAKAGLKAIRISKQGLRR
jgi:cold shock CspA family protein